MSTEKTCPFHPFTVELTANEFQPSSWPTEQPVEKWQPFSIHWHLVYSTVLFLQLLNTGCTVFLYHIKVFFLVWKMRACDGKRNATPWPVTLSRSFSADTRIFDFSKGRNQSVCLIWHRHIAGYQGFWMMIFFALVSMSSDGSTRVTDHRTKGRQGGLEGVLEIWWPTVYRFLPPKNGSVIFPRGFPCSYLHDNEDDLVSNHPHLSRCIGSVWWNESQPGHWSVMDLFPDRLPFQKNL